MDELNQQVQEDLNEVDLTLVTMPTCEFCKEQMTPILADMTCVCGECPDNGAVTLPGTWVCVCGGLFAYQEERVKLIHVFPGSPLEGAGKELVNIFLDRDAN